MKKVEGEANGVHFAAWYEMALPYNRSLATFLGNIGSDKEPYPGYDKVGVARHRVYIPSKNRPLVVVETREDRRNEDVNKAVVSLYSKFSGLFIDLKTELNDLLEDVAYPVPVDDDIQSRGLPELDEIMDCGEEWADLAVESAFKHQAERYSEVLVDA